MINFGWVKGLVRATTKTATQYAPQILMGLGTAGTVGAVVYAAKAGEKAVYLIDQAEVAKAKALQEEEQRKAQLQGYKDSAVEPFMEPLTWQEKVKACWKVYIPPAGLLLFSLGCFWSAQGINATRQAVLAGLYSTAEASLHEYQAKVVELIGKDGEKEVTTAIAQDKVDRLPPPPTPVIDGGSTCWCLIDNQYFRSSYVKIKDAQNIFNQNMINQMYGSKLELYWLLDPEGEYLKPDDETGQVGWSIDKLLVLDIDPAFGPNHEQILAITYKDGNNLRYPPMPGFGKVW